LDYLSESTRRSDIRTSRKFFKSNPKPSAAPISTGHYLYRRLPVIFFLSFLAFPVRADLSQSCFPSSTPYTVHRIVAIQGNSSPVPNETNSILPCAGFISRPILKTLFSRNQPHIVSFGAGTNKIGNGQFECKRTNEQRPSSGASERKSRLLATNPGLVVHR